MYEALNFTYEREYRMSLIKLVLLFSKTGQKFVLKMYKHNIQDILINHK